ncbi:hypothetical protein [Mucilaginibacter terrae]|uniref:DUF4252 domain-containing protein n=1 Tax=Mucilaginibacter terrae TaxID=1955052 RepID=A0ABU3GXR4_9SPHI|nr:hypothetical protein [Mucilaginibacter terrae]MDT3404564.1 hypothetical protein [Mucilaginibacter terrae]
MKTIGKQISKIILLAAGILCFGVLTVEAQHKKSKITKPAARPTTSTTLSSFIKNAAEAGIEFRQPLPFKEVAAANNENFSFDYGMNIPGQDFEIWLQVHSLKQNWASYEQMKNVSGKTLANPDSAYVEAARAHAAALSDDTKFFTRSLSTDFLEQYNADAGKTYLLNLADLPETKHYKYAFIIALQKDHTGYLLAVCLTNVKGPDFFKNINKARDCMRFK